MTRMMFLGCLAVTMIGSCLIFLSWAMVEHEMTGADRLVISTLLMENLCASEPCVTEGRFGGSPCKSREETIWIIHQDLVAQSRALPLIELMVALAILAIIVAVAYTGLHDLCGAFQSH